MHPLLWEHPRITSYGTLIVLGLLAAWILARFLARRARVAPSLIDLLAPILTAAGLLGAALFGWLTDRATGTPVHGGVLLGALLLATTAGIVFALLARIPLGVLGDICAAPVMLGLAFGRVGCFLAGCCYGRPCAPSLGVVFPHNSLVYFDQLSRGLLGSGAARPLPVYPAQLLESAAAALLAAALILRFPRRKISGELFLQMALGYTALRCALEFLRGDNPPILGPLTFSQLVGSLTFLASAITMAVRRRNAARWRLGLTGFTW